MDLTIKQVFPNGIWIAKDADGVITSFFLEPEIDEEVQRWISGSGYGEWAVLRWDTEGKFDVDTNLPLEWLELPWRESLVNLKSIGEEPVDGTTTACSRCEQPIQTFTDKNSSAEFRDWAGKNKDIIVCTKCIKSLDPELVECCFCGQVT